MNIESGSLIPLIPVLILSTLLLGVCIVDIVRKPQVRHLPKTVWVLLVLFVIPLGAVLYLTLGRDKSIALSDEDLR